MAERSMTTPAEKRKVFRSLHESGFFLLPNAWDCGSAVRLTNLGFRICRPVWPVVPMRKMRGVVSEVIGASDDEKGSRSRMRRAEASPARPPIT
jgi:hypothetical protein